ncbi:hypothetical protein MMC30_008920 [Trapelia coarctata]|nr:hypothetical protein [Trapelia coarctata]
MSYPPPQGGYPPYGAPPPGQYPQYGTPPPGQHPPPGYPPQQAPPPQSHGYYGQPPPNQGYPPQQQQYYGGPPPPQQGQYGAPPPQQQYGAPPPGQYGAPPPQQYGAPQYGMTAPTPPSPGYGPNTMPVNDATAAAAADSLRKAMKGFGTDETTLIRTLCHYPAPLIPHLKQVYQQRHKRSLESDIASETGSYLEFALLSILRGPLQNDVFLLNKALKGIGTNEGMLNDVVIARSNADLKAIKQAYQATYRRTLEADVAGDLSAKTERLFSMILSATRQEESAPVVPQAIDADVMELQRATEGRMGTDELSVCSILSNRSNGQLRAIAQAYETKFRLSLEKVLDKEFSGHMKQALIEMVRAASDPAMRDAIRLEECMAGPGTKDEMLVSRVVSMHWDRNHMGQVKGAYKARFKRDLVGRIKGETSGDYERLLVAMVE